MNINPTLIRKRIHFIIRHNGHAYRYPTNIKCEPEMWDYYKCRTKRDFKKNIKLDRMESGLKELSSSQILCLEKYDQPFLSYLETNPVWVDTAKLIRRFRPKTNWEHLDQGFILGFKEWLLNDAVKRDGTGYSINTFSLHYGRIKSAVRFAIRNDNPKANERIFGIRTAREEKTEVYLTESELKRIEKLELSGIRDTVRKMFLVGAYSGARFSDFKRMSNINIVGRKLKYMAQKTGVNVTVKLHPYVRRVLTEGMQLFGEVKEETERAYVNRHIKQICRMAGINEDVLVSKKVSGKVKSVLKPKYTLVTSHTARKSYATNLALNGVPVVAIQKFLGHKDVVTTSRYILCDGEDFVD